LSAARLVSGRARVSKVRAGAMNEARRTETRAAVAWGVAKSMGNFLSEWSEAASFRKAATL
jgi:hypothetical protein